MLTQIATRMSNCAAEPLAMGPADRQSGAASCARCGPGADPRATFGLPVVQAWLKMLLGAACCGRKSARSESQLLPPPLVLPRLSHRDDEDEDDAAAVTFTRHFSRIYESMFPGAALHVLEPVRHPHAPSPCACLPTSRRHMHRQHRSTKQRSTALP